MKDTIAIGECSDHKVCKHFKSQIEFFFFKQRGINKARKKWVSGIGGVCGVRTVHQGMFVFAVS